MGEVSSSEIDTLIPDSDLKGEREKEKESEREKERERDEERERKTLEEEKDVIVQSEEKAIEIKPDSTSNTITDPNLDPDSLIEATVLVDSALKQAQQDQITTHKQEKKNKEEQEEKEEKEKENEKEEEKEERQLKKGLKGRIFSLLWRKK